MRASLFLLDSSHRSGSRTRTLAPVALVIATFVLAAFAGPARAQDANLDAPFSQPQYLIHLTGTSTMDGFVAKDAYMLINTQPQNGVWLSPDGEGGTFSNTVELLGGPFSTPREVCGAAQSLSTQAFTSTDGVSFNCAPPPPPPVEQTQPADQPAATPDQTTSPAPDAAPPPPPANTSSDWGQQISNWWNTSTLGEKAVAAVAVFGIGTILTAIINWLFGSAMTLNGTMSTFGGPNDKGMQPGEGLALFDPADVASAGDLFLAQQPAGTTGLGRRLNPNAAYIACRWDYTKTPRNHLRSITVTVTNPANGKSIQVRPVDWGPNADTGRVADLSPGAANALGLSTDQTCTVSIPLPQAK